MTDEQAAFAVDVLGPVSDAYPPAVKRERKAVADEYRRLARTLGTGDAERRAKAAWLKGYVGRCEAGGGD